MTEPAGSERRGLVVAGAATGIGLLLGILYAWSVLKSGIPDAWGWSHADKALPYAVACLVFSLSMVPAGRLQDRLGPRGIATLGGALTGLGCVVSGLAGSSLIGFVLGFGVITGVGIGCGYSAITPAAIKWFPPQRTGLVTGIVVAGFGLSSVYVAPLVSWLLQVFSTTGPDGSVQPGVSSTMIALGAGIAVGGIALAQLVRNPPGAVAPSRQEAPAGPRAAWSQVLRVRLFWVLWLMYFCGAGAGLMFIGVAQDLGKRSLGSWAFVVVVVLALGNAGGRILAGAISDRIGRSQTLRGAFVSQAVVVAVLYGLSGGRGGPGAILAVVFLLGLNYGSNLSLFPAAAKDAFGLASFGVNYGLLFTAWGAAGLVLPWVNGRVRDATGGDALAYAVVVGMMVLGALLSARMGRQDAARRPRTVHLSCEQP